MLRKGGEPPPSSSDAFEQVGVAAVSPGAVAQLPDARPEPHGTAVAQATQWDVSSFLWGGNLTVDPSQNNLQRFQQVSVCGRFCFFPSKVLQGGFLGRLAATHDRQQAGKQQSSERSGGNHGGGHGAGGWRSQREAGGAEVAVGAQESPASFIPIQSPARWDAAGPPCLTFGCRSQI